MYCLSTKDGEVKIFWLSRYLSKRSRFNESRRTYERCDVFLGVPFNIMFYSMFTHMLANQFNFVAEEFIWTGGDVHIYSNHVEPMAEYKTQPQFDTPTIEFKPDAKGKDVREITQADYEILNYQHGPKIAAKVAV